LLDGILALVFLAILLSAPAYAGSVTYTYDVLGRLATATYSTGAVITYSYDATGNRTSVVTTGAP
jgi:YD repeat-containing protein